MRRQPHAFRSLLLAATLLALPRATVAQAPVAGDTNYTFTRAMVTMRDGVRLNTVFFVPKRASGPLPILFVRTPYGVPGPAYSPTRAYAELHADGYIFAMQDIRGKYESEGTFVKIGRAHV